MLDDAAHERDLQRLALHFNEVERSSWVFARFTSTAYLQRIRAELVLRLNLQIVDYALGPTRRDPLAYLDELPPAAQGQRLIVSFTDLEQALPELFGYLDFQREAYTVHPHGLLFWVTEDLWRQVMQRAPNFYSRHGGVFDFRSPAPDPAPALAQDAALQAQVADLQAQVQALEVLRSRYGDAWVNQQQAELTAQQHALLTGSGAIAQGAGAQAASGGSVVAEKIYGDVTIFNFPWQRWVSAVYEKAPVGRVPLDVLQAAYLRALAEECSRLPLGVMDPKWVRTTQDRQIALPDVYVDLDVVTPALGRDQDERELAQRLARGEGRERTPLLDAVTAPDARALVLLGDAGSGKSTFVSYLTFLLATQSPRTPAAFSGLLPVRLLLREVTAWQAPANPSAAGRLLWDALKTDVARRLGQDAAERVFRHLQHRLLQQGGLFLLDGLDEVPEANQRRQAILQAVRTLAATLPATSRVLVTARPYAYADPQWRLPGFRVLTLAPFSQEQVERFIVRWYEAAAPAVGLSLTDAQVRGSLLRQALHDRPYLADLASRPLLLTLMATLHSSWGELPADRADLYEETVELLLERWQRAKEVNGPDGQPVIEPGIAQVLQVGKDQIRRALQTLAYTVHRRQRAAATVGDDAADISEGEVLVAFKLLLSKVDTEALLRYPRERAGLLLARRPGVYAFPHRSFQEFLAACYLADQPDAIESLVSLVNDDPAWWREVAILTAGKKKRGGLGGAVAVVGALIPDLPADDPKIAATRWRVAVIAGQALLELHFPEQARDQRHYQAVLRRAQQWLLAFMRSGALTPRERAEAGVTLARLGDPRSEVLTSAAMEFCWVPPGSFWMGSQDDPDAEKDESPKGIDLSYGYWIGRYPVTNAQFEEFVAAGGYCESRYWREAEAADLWSVTGFAGWRDKGPRQKPYDFGEPHHVANHPVVGISWYEALAYTRWQNERLAGQIPAGWAVQLPNEPEWEKAARGGVEIPAQPLIRSAAKGSIGKETPPLHLNPQERQRYPWGNESDANRANYDESGIGTTSAVGCFPGGASVYGVEELSGNVWEWTRSLYGKYPYPASGAKREERENLTAAASESRVLRGGSYFVSRARVRCALRHGNPPNFGLEDYGLRVVVAPSASAV